MLVTGIQGATMAMLRVVANSIPGTRPGMTVFYRTESPWGRGWSASKSSDFLRVPPPALRATSPTMGRGERAYFSIQLLLGVSVAVPSAAKPDVFA